MCDFSGDPDCDSPNPNLKLVISAGGDSGLRFEDSFAIPNPTLLGGPCTLLIKRKGAMP